MKKLIIFILLSVCMSTMAQRQKVSVGKDGAMVVSGDTVAYIEKVGCKMLSVSCQFFITDKDDNMMITVSMRSFIDKDWSSPTSPEGARMPYLVFSFHGMEATAEVDCPSMIVKEESVAKIVAQWRLIRDGKLDPEAVAQFVTHYGNRFSEKELRQSQSPSILIIQDIH